MYLSVSFDFNIDPKMHRILMDHTDSYSSPSFSLESENGELIDEVGTLNETNCKSEGASRARELVPTRERVLSG